MVVSKWNWIMDWAIVAERTSVSGAECLCVRPSFGRFELGICQWVPDPAPIDPGFVVSAGVGDVHDIDPGCLIDAPDASSSPMMRSFTLSRSGRLIQISGTLNCGFNPNLDSIRTALAAMGWDESAVSQVLMSTR